VWLPWEPPQVLLVPWGDDVGASQITLSQVAAALASALGEDYCAAVPKAGKPIVKALQR